MILKQVGFHVDLSRCTGCKACFIACKDKNNTQTGVNYRRVEFVETGQIEEVDHVFISTLKEFAYSISCNHCSHPKCVEACETGAMHKREEDGVVVVDQTKCIGCIYCSLNCPYGAPQYSEALQKMTKCDTCLDIRVLGESPACVEACPFYAIEFGEISLLEKKYGKNRDAPELPDSNITQPNIIFTMKK